MCPGSCSFPFADLELHRTTTRTCSIASLTSDEGLDKKHTNGESYRRRIGPPKKPKRNSRSRVWKPKQLGSSLDCPVGSCCFYPKQLEELIDHLNAFHKKDKVEEQERLEKANVRQCARCRSYLSRSQQCCVPLPTQEPTPDDVPPLVRPPDEGTTSTIVSQRAVPPGNTKEEKASESVPRKQLSEQKARKRCGICGQVFTSERQLMTHPCKKKRASTIRDKFQFSCLKCEDWKSNNKKPYYEHLNEKHGDVRWPGNLLKEWGLLQCPRCNKVLIQMKRHEKGCTGRRASQRASSTSGSRTHETEGKEGREGVGNKDDGATLRLAGRSDEQKGARSTSDTTTPLALDDSMMDEDMAQRERGKGGQIETKRDSGDQMTEGHPPNASATLANIGDLLSQNNYECERKTSEGGTLTHPPVSSQEVDEDVVEVQGEEEIRQSFDPKHVQYVPHLWRSVPEHLWAYGETSVAQGSKQLQSRTT